MKSTMISILILTVLMNVFGFDPDSGKTFEQYKHYIKNDRTGEHYIELSDTLDLILNEDIPLCLEIRDTTSDSGWVRSGVYIGRNTIKCRVVKENKEIWWDKDSYVLLNGDHYAFIRLLQKFKSLRIFQFYATDPGSPLAKYVIASLFIRVPPENSQTPDTSGTTPEGDPIYSSDQIAICSYFEPNEPLDTLVIEPGKSAMLTLRVYTQSGLNNTICDKWEINYCDSEYTTYVPYPEIECSEQGIGYITAVSGSEKITLVLVFQTPVSTKTIKKLNYSKKQKNCFLFKINGQQIRERQKAYEVIVTKNRKALNVR